MPISILTRHSQAPHLTTEYTPTPRGEALPSKSVPPPLTQPHLPAKIPASSSEPHTTIATPPIQDLSTLPPVTAPPSHPPINPSEPGVIEGRSIFEVDMDALTEKPWRRPGSDVSDYFNYGFDEMSWEAYCYRRRDLGEMANHLKGVVTVRTVALCRRLTDHLTFLRFCPPLLEFCGNARRPDRRASARGPRNGHDGSHLAHVWWGTPSRSASDDECWGRRSWPDDASTSSST